MKKLILGCKCFTISMFLLALNLEILGQRIQIGNAGANVFQTWRTVKSSTYEYRKYLDGKILSIKMNSGGPLAIDDDDWNVFVDPDNSYDFLLINGQGRVNCDIHANKIELEVRNDFPFASHFNVNDEIRCYGWWVEDLGHSPCGNAVADHTGGKTELHPFLFLRTRNVPNRDKILCLSDHSGRFENFVNDDVNSFPFTIKLNPYGPGMFDPLGVNNEIKPIDARSGIINGWQVEEEILLDTQIKSQERHGEIIDVFVAGLSQAFRTKVDTRSIDYFNISIKPEFSTSGSYTFNRHFHRFFFGDYKRTYIPFVREEVKVNVVDHPENGMQSLLVSVLLILPTEVNAVYSKWKYEHTLDAAPFRLNITEIENPIGNKIEFKFRYSPANGSSQTDWNVNMVASDKAKNYTPILFGNLFTGSLPKNSRKFFSIGLNYQVQPTAVHFQFKRTFDIVRDNIALISSRDDRAVQKRTHFCLSGYEITPIILKPHSNVRIDNVEYFVKRIRDHDGNPITGASLVPVGTTLIDLPEATIEKSNGSEKLIIKFKEFAGRPLIGASYLRYNNAELLIQSKVSTGLGESTIYSQSFRSESCIRNMDIERSPVELDSIFVETIALIQAMNKLNMKKLSKSISSSLVTEWSKNRTIFFELSLVYNSASKGQKKWIEMLHKARSNTKLTEDEVEDVNHLLEILQKLKLLSQS